MFLFAFQSLQSNTLAIYPAKTSQDAFLHFLKDIITIHRNIEQSIATLEKFSVIPAKL